MTEEQIPRDRRLFKLFMNEEASRKLKEGKVEKLEQLAGTYNLTLEELRVARDTLLALKDTAGEILKPRTLYPP